MNFGSFQVVVIAIMVAQAFAQKCLKNNILAKEIDFDALGKFDKWWEVKNNLNAKQDETNCLTIRNLKNTKFGGSALTEYVKANFDITENVDKFLVAGTGSYKKHIPKTKIFTSLHQLAAAASRNVDDVGIVKRNQLIENHEVSWYTDYQDIIVLRACTESGQILWSIFTNTPTPTKRYHIKIARILKRMGGNVKELHDTVCQEIE